MNPFEEAARPVIFENADPNFPYWGKGSSILLANSQYYFWMTAAHVVTNLGGSAETLRIFPSDKSRVSLPFDERYAIAEGASADEDYRDIFALRINIPEFDAAGDAPLIAQDVERGLQAAEELVLGDELWIVGYAAEGGFIDYDCGHIKNTRSVIRALYKGPSNSDHCHTAKVESSIRLASFDGLSGSPIFHMRSGIFEGQKCQYPLLVGMLLRGTASSSLVHFVSARVIGELIRLASTNDNVP